MAAIAGDRFLGKCRRGISVDRIRNGKRPAGVALEAFHCDWPGKSWSGIVLVARCHVISTTFVKADRGLEKMIADSSHIAGSVVTGADHIVDAVIPVFSGMGHPLKKD